jgi:uncharacterized repeat protein (TIGR04138 family)
MHAPNFDDVLDKIVAQESRYHREAYLFVREALDHAQKPAAKGQKDEARHVTGQEQLEGIRQYGLSQYGPMTAMVLKEWGVERCEDFGEIVFRMIDFGLLCKTEEDSRNDFKGGYTFEDAFSKPFRPSKKRPPVAAAGKENPTKA